MKTATEAMVRQIVASILTNISGEKIDHEEAQWAIRNPKELAAGVTKLINNHCRLQTIAPTIDLDADPFVPDGWEVVEHTKGGQFDWDPAKINLWLAEEQKTGVIEGNNLRKRVAPKNPFNANMLDYLYEHPELIPESWKGKAIFFWGTIYRDADGYLYVRYLRWDGRQWYWHSGWLGNGWSSYDPAAVPAS